MKYLLTGLGKGTYNSGNPISADKLWKTYSTPLKLSEIDQDGASDGQSIAGSAALGKWTPSSVGSKWTDVSGNLYRNSQVTIGQSSIINADFGIKQNNLTNAVRIDQPTTGRRNAISTYGFGGVERHRLDSYGVAQWLLYNGIGEAGALAFTTPTGFIGIQTASNFSFSTSTRGYIIWDSINSNGAADSCQIGTRGVSHLGISATGRMRFGSTSGYAAATYSHKIVSGDTIIAAWYDSIKARFIIHDTDGIQTDDLISSLAKPWKLGQKIDATVSLDTTKYVSVQIDGVEYKLALAI